MEKTNQANVFFVEEKTYAVTGSALEAKGVTPEEVNAEEVVVYVPGLFSSVEETKDVFTEAVTDYLESLKETEVEEDAATDTEEELETVEAAAEVA